MALYTHPYSNIYSWGQWCICVYIVHLLHTDIYSWGHAYAQKEPKLPERTQQCLKFYVLSDTSGTEKSLLTASASKITFSVFKVIIHPNIFFEWFQQQNTTICKLALTVNFLPGCFMFQTLGLARQNYQVWLAILFLICRTNNFAPEYLASLFFVGICLAKPRV